MTRRPEIIKAVQQARAEMIGSWPGWEAEAGERSQCEQRPSAGNRYMNKQVEAVLYDMLDKILPRREQRPLPPCGMPSHHETCECNGKGGDR